ncbi:hypothetical protein F0P96_20585 [Hymenobacter busanensis]|uniref:KAP NTPase domain-containing protein n=1 Tax=Hymenobacter busanensis TaxID=2607656 RepID=A0AA88FH57_9BACT|nr:Qat anti-phage system ATPase QatA [Hymenobacter busanensis]KAA9325097.1 hypothetical protein F0P96_20585 [Hymenobacter busanensis]
MWNDKETNVDLLGHRRIAQTIVEILREEELRPLTVGIHGSWGAGKTSILSLIEAELKDDDTTLCLTFNGWLYQGYDDTKSALMEAVVHALLSRRSVGASAVAMGKRLFKRINWLKAAKVAGSLAMTAATGMSPAALFGLPGLLASAKDLFADKEAKPAGTTVNVTVEAEEEDWLKPEQATVPAQIQAFRDELQALIKEAGVERLVVLVDDLDRCLPTSVIDILEAVKLFLFVEGSAFILATDEQMIEYAVRRHFPDLPVSQAEYTKHYLEKLIQIPIRVPSLNALQTQNYIRFLLLQNHLQHDKARLAEICTAFEQARETPYDNKELTYAFITEQLGGSNQDLRNILNVAEQLGSTLAKELRGNPRNVKRFLNTLFMRQRVARIYGLEQKVQLDVLAKLMLLERFHAEQYEAVVADVTAATDGRSATVQQLEATDPEPVADAKPKAKSKPVTPAATAPAVEEELRQWAQFAPALAEVDLRPYIFISRERVLSFQPGEELPPALMPLYQALLTGVRMQFVKHEADAKALTPSQARLLFEQLQREAVTTGDWQTVPKAVDGLVYLVQQQSALEAPLIAMMNSVAAKDLGVWVGTKFGFFTTPDGKAARRTFLANLQQDPQVSGTLKTLLSQMQTAD